MSTFFTDLVTKVDSICNSFVLIKAQALIEGITPACTTLFIIYVGLWGIAMMRGTIEEPVMDAGMRFVKLGLVMGLALSLGNYQDYVYKFLWTTPDAMAHLLSTGNQSTGDKMSQVALLDKIFNSGMAIGDRAFQKMGLMSGIGASLGYLAFALVAYAATLLLTAYAAILIIVAKIALAGLLAMGPLFIALIIFQATQKFFESWLGLCMNFVFLTILTALFVAFCQTLLGSFLDDIAAAETLKIQASLEMLVIGVLSIVILAQAPSLASSLGGGAALTTMNVASAAARKLGGQFKRQPRYGKDGQMKSYKSNVGVATSAVGAPVRMARKLYKKSRANSVSNG